MTRVVFVIIQALLCGILINSCGGGFHNDKHAEKIRELESRLSELENEKSEKNQYEEKHYEPKITINEVRIGDQVWMAENLNVDRFRNGDLIPHAKTVKEWEGAGKNKQPAWCYYDNDPANGEKYGKLYNWYAVNDPRGLAPKGWHVPSETEWTELIVNFGGHKVVGANLKSTSGWLNNGNGNNSSGFSGLPGGQRLIPYGSFILLGVNGHWWSSSEDLSEDIGHFSEEDSVYQAWSFILFSKSKEVTISHGFKEDGLSVRCIRD